MTAAAVASLTTSYPTSKPPLTRKEEGDLIRAWQQHGDNDARGRIVEANVRFVFQVCLPYRVAAEKMGIEFEDLLQEGNCGLLHACDRFDPERGFKFISYAVNWITHHLREHLYRYRLPVTTPATARVLVGKYFGLRKRDPNATHEEIVEGMKLRLAQEHVLNQALAPVFRIDSVRFKGGPDADRDESNAYRVEPDLLKIDSPYQNFEDEDLQTWTCDTIHDILHAKLSHFELGVIKLYFGLWRHKPMTLEEIGKLFGLTRERIRQIKERALDVLRDDKRMAGVFSQLN